MHLFQQGQQPDLRTNQLSSDVSCFATAAYDDALLAAKKQYKSQCSPSAADDA